MVVKWVCSVCGSNNMAKKSGIMVCSVCSSLRTTEVLTVVNAKVANTESAAAVSLKEILGRYSLWQSLQIMFPVVMKRTTALIITILICALIWLAYCFISPAFPTSIQNVEKNTELIFQAGRFNKQKQNVSDRIIPDVKYRLTFSVQKISDCYLEKMEHLSSTFYTRKKEYWDQTVENFSYNHKLSFEQMPRGLMERLQKTSISVNGWVYASQDCIQIINNSNEIISRNVGQITRTYIAGNWESLLALGHLLSLRFRHVLKILIEIIGHIRQVLKI